MERRRDALSREVLKEFHADALSPHRARGKIAHISHRASVHLAQQGDAPSVDYAPFGNAVLPLLLIRRYVVALLPQRAALLVLLITALVLPVSAFAAFNFFSINENAAVMYDAPSLKAGKLYVASLHLPVEAVVKVEGWVKVRDSKGNLAWVEEKVLSEKRYVIVTVPLAEAYQAPNTNSPIAFKAQQDVVMEWLEPAVNGWVKVRHRDGQMGYVRTTQVWGS
ncbi:SH3 domain-containing protein [Nitrosospira sp. Is2]|uniref:SH3 domain-containing protein n=1 Tax=Nitrosospira sp. Is2 TaxID=3080532 RepID=UPI0029544768|nr:SH3 domain-containing protein [Nitrosospira sp. Is2]WON73314.1 SH3 domain-containing protein [Nitrosospira sp. Is2]